MKELNKNIFKYLLTTIFTCIALIGATQTEYNYSQVEQHEGLVMQRIDDDDPNQASASKAVMNFHSHTDQGIDFLYLRASEFDEAQDGSQTFLENNIVITDGGLMVIGSDSDCSQMTFPTEYIDNTIPGGSSTFSNLKLFVNGQIATSSGVATNYIVSDQRLKKNVRSLNKGLDIIRQANFVEFEYKNISGAKKGQKFYGVLAQEMQEILPSTVVEVQKRLKPSDTKKTDILMFNPNDLFYAGLNAIKELDQENQGLKERVDELEQELTERENLEKRVEDLEKLLEQMITGKTEQQTTLPQIGTGTDGTMLEQNSPNPLHESTVIAYHLPENTHAAHIVIQDLNGRTITQYDLPIGSDRITFNADQYGLLKGTYVYSLIVDDKIVDTKKMILIE